MVSKLSRQGAVNPAGTVSRPAPDDRAVAPAGPIRPAAWTTRGQPQTAQEPDQQPAASDKPNPFGRRGAAPAEQAEQRAQITRKLTPQGTEHDPNDHGGTPHDENPPVATRARAQFSPQVRQQLEAPKGEADQMAQEADAQADAKAAVEGVMASPGPKRTRRSADKVAAVEVTAATAPQPDNKWIRREALQMAIDYRARVLDDKDDVLQTAAAFLDFLENGGAE